MFGFGVFILFILIKIVNIKRLFCNAFQDMFNDMTNLMVNLNQWQTINLGHPSVAVLL